MTEHISRKDKAMSTKRAVRRAYEDLLREKALDDIKISDICKLAGVSIGTFYHYYDSKADFVIEDQDEFDSRVKDAWTEWEKTCTDPMESIRFLFLLAIELKTEKGVVYTTSLYRYQLFAFRSSGSTIDKKKYENINRNVFDPDRFYQKTLLSQITKAVELGLLTGDADVIFGDIMVVITGTIYNWCAHAGIPELIPRGLRVFNALMDSYKTEG